MNNHDEFHDDAGNHLSYEHIGTEERLIIWILQPLLLSFFSTATQPQ